MTKKCELCGDERQELDVDAVMDCIDQVYDCDHNGSGFVDNWRTVAQAICNTFKPKVEVTDARIENLCYDIHQEVEDGKIGSASLLIKQLLKDKGDK